MRSLWDPERGNTCASVPHLGGQWWGNNSRHLGIKLLGKRSSQVQIMNHMNKSHTMKDSVNGQYTGVLLSVK